MKIIWKIIHFICSMVHNFSIKFIWNIEQLWQIYNLHNMTRATLAYRQTIPFFALRLSIEITFNWFSSYITWYWLRHWHTNTFFIDSNCSFYWILNHHHISVAMQKKCICSFDGWAEAYVQYDQIPVESDVSNIFYHIKWDLSGAHFSICFMSCDIADCDSYSAE